MIATVDSFVKIFKFYQQNKVSQSVLNRQTGKYETINLNNKFKHNTLLYEDTIDVYLNSLVLNSATLTYDKDSDTIQTALNAREKMKTYFNKVLYPGSYAFNTRDNISFRKLMLDWTSTIKTIQDSSKRLTDAYSLSSEDVDKAIRGFGAGFVNRSSIISIEKRKQYLLNICDLYAIKGTPQSIVKALNTIGLNDIYIREGWMYKDEVVDDIKIRWEAQKIKNSFDNIGKFYQDNNTIDDLYTNWDWFINKIQDSSHSDPHWFYTKEEIEQLNADKDIYLKLPSITPYFGVEFVSNADKQTDAWLTIFTKLDELFKKHLTNENVSKDSTIWFSTYNNKINLLEAYTTLIYALIRLDDHLLCDNFKSFLESSEIQNIPDFTGKYQYFQIIYWFYRNYIKNQDELHADNYRRILNQFIPIKSSDYCNYEQVLNWWLTSDYDVEEEKILDVNYIQPTKVETEFTNFACLNWKSVYPVGRYSVEVFSQSRLEMYGNGWKEIIHGGYIYDTDMTIFVPTDEIDNYGQDESCYRIKIYHTKNNLPDIFFNQPFNLDNTPTDTMLDMIMRYNGPSTSFSYYNDNPLKNAFDHQDIDQNSETYDVIQGYHYEQTNYYKIRYNEIDQDLRGYYNARFNYPALTQLYEDRIWNVNANFYNYVDWSIKDFFDTQKHLGLLANNRNTELDDSGRSVERKWPLNSKWNWAVDSKFVYFCYEANKWCRIRYDELAVCNINDIVGSTPLKYGDKIIKDGKLYVYVSLNKFAVINNVQTQWDQIEEVADERGFVSYKHNDILPNGNIVKDSKLCRDHAIAKLADSYVCDLIYKDCTLTPEDLNKSDVTKMLLSEVFDVYEDPYGNVNARSYDYKTFLSWLYNSRLILDFNTGIIYENHKTFKIDDQIYFKCIDGNTKNWVRLTPEFKWDGCDDAETIYSSNAEDSLGILYPMYTFQSRYDSLRFLDGPIFDSIQALNDAEANDQIDSSINYIMVRNAVLDGTVETVKKLPLDADIGKIYYVSEDHLNYIKVNNKEWSELTNVITNGNELVSGYPAVFKRTYAINNLYTKIITKWELCATNEIQKVNYGINPDLLEFLESRYAQDDQYYVDLVSDMTDSISTYMETELGIDDTVLDLTIASWASSGIVKKLVNFYKPKRARLLFISNVIEGDYGIGNNLDVLDVSDNGYNYYDLATYRWGNPQFNKRDLSKSNRQRIREVIHEYLPIDDTIFKVGDERNYVYSSRELRSGNSKIPVLELYDKMVSLETQTCNNVVASFYVNGFGEGMNGFYYKLDDIYTNNRFYFKQVYFMIHDEQKKVHSQYRWALFNVNEDDPNHSNCIYVANKETIKPNIDEANKTDNTVRYALRKVANADNKFIDGLTYNLGEFTNSGIVLTNKRTCDPIVYFKDFSDPRCNGFYYQDEKVHPSNEDGVPTYFNQFGKILKHIKLEYTGIEDKTDLKRLGSKCTSMWIICDNKHLATLKDADYIAFCYDPKFKGTVETKSDLPASDTLYNIYYVKNENKYYFWVITEINKKTQAVTYNWVEYTGDVSSKNDFIWDSLQSSVTKIFRRNPNSVTTESVYGMRVSDLIDNQTIIDDRYIKTTVVPDNYNLYRRNHFNTVELKNQPIAYVTSNNKLTGNCFSNKVKIDTDTFDYVMDQDGNTFGALDITNDKYLKLINEPIADKPDFTISCHVYPKDEDTVKKLFGNSCTLPAKIWYLITLTSEVNYDYWLDKSFNYILNPVIEANEELKSILYQIRKDFPDASDDEIESKFENDSRKQTLETFIRSTTNNFCKDGLGIVDVYFNIDAVPRDLELCNNFDIAINKFRGLIETLERNIDRLRTICEYCGFGLRTDNEYNIFYINKEQYPELKHNFISKETTEFRNVNVKVSDYAIWDYVLSDWYIGVINDFRILRSRPEPVKSKNSKSANAYRPLFAINEPRTVYPMWGTGLPENITGGRISGYNADPYNDGKVLKQEVNPLWKSSLPEDLDAKLIVDGGSMCYPPRLSINDGDELISSSDYKSGENVPYWWERKPEEYKTGAIHHRPAYISIKTKVDDPYPLNPNGQNQKCGKYHDIGLRFDGKGNQDFYHDGDRLICKTNDKDLYPISTYDNISHFTSEYNKYVYALINDLTLVRLVRDIDKVQLDTSKYSVARDILWQYTNKHRLFDFVEKKITMDGVGDTYCPKNDNNCLYIPDLDQFKLSQESMENGIFHETLKFKSSIDELNGTWIHSYEVPIWKDGDFKECYIKDSWYAILTYQKDSGYFWWEIRNENGETKYRTYIKPIHNQSRTMDWYDYVNWNQIDLCCQELCVFKDDDYNTFKKECWSSIEQEKIDGRFSCGSWIKLNVVESKYIENCPEGRYFDGYNYFFYNKETDKWYKVTNRLKGEWSENWDISRIEDIEIDPEHTAIDVEMGTFFAKWIDDHKILPPSGYLYKNGKLYIKISKDLWINIEAELTEDKPEFFEQWKFNVDGENAYVNVLDSSNAECEEEEFIYPDILDIIETYAKLVKFNGTRYVDWTKHFIDVKSVNNDISLARCSFRDGVIPKVYEYIENDKGDFIKISHIETWNDGEENKSRTYTKFYTTKKVIPSGWTQVDDTKYIRKLIDPDSWTKIPGAKFSVKFLVDGILYVEGIVPYGGSSLFPDDPVKKQYKFSGWDKSIDDLTNITEDIEVHGSMFKDIITVTYDSNF